ncbi:hypothetical protein P389DRAFT_194969 [Cystobasidium minutum MCA 4210]|uniref:uncharacterized protein n=1 Tax=Cystobasidium minutum MCA 4210 TaxID=1397322 RepID=UPI0034CD317D|eukprot:jgi/Rhomi1/194969/gm1.3183_g
MSTSTTLRGNKKAKLAAPAAEDAVREPVAGPSSQTLDHAQNVDDDEDEEEAMDGDSEELDGSEDDDDDDDNESGVSEGSVSGDEDEDEEDDYEDIMAANAGKKKKRKRALPTHAFGSMLSSLIAAPVPTKPLRPLHPPASAEALERRARTALQAQKHEREERGHVKDVIAGWTPRPNVPFSQWNTIDPTDSNVEYALGGAEKEKELRRLAQRGVVRLFNAIKAAQYTEETVNKTGGVAAIKAEEAGSSSRQAIKDASPAPSSTGSIAGMQPVTRAPNVLGSRGRQEALANLSKASFLDLFKSGSAKPKTAV